MRTVGLVFETKIEDKKVDELKALCTEKGIEFNSKTTKNELIKLLEGVE